MLLPIPDINVISDLLLPTAKNNDAEITVNKNHTSICTLITEKWLMITVPVVIYGVMRYMQLIYEKNEGESPHKVLLSDQPLLTSVAIWVVMVVGILYFV